MLLIQSSAGEKDVASHDRSTRSSNAVLITVCLYLYEFLKLLQQDLQKFLRKLAREHVAMRSYARASHAVSLRVRCFLFATHRAHIPLVIEQVAKLFKRRDERCAAIIITIAKRKLRSFN